MNTKIRTEIRARAFVDGRVQITVTTDDVSVCVNVNADEATELANQLTDSVDQLKGKITP